jgi:hypothetical protein
MTQKDTVVELLQRALEQEEWQLVADALEVLLIDEDNCDFYEESLEQ